jgi:ATP-dependent Clp protease ATP-binding subunit ClpC
MFERYTERARRVLFFARYEASQLGSLSIETEHLLLGLIREGKGLTSRIFARSHLSLESIRKEIEGRTVFREKVWTAVEIPFSAETKRVLQYAAEEADRLLHNYIGTEHLLLGLLREERSVAATIVMEKGMRLNTVREVEVLYTATTARITGPKPDTQSEIQVEDVARVIAFSPPLFSSQGRMR